jgi:hypothetical protein
MTYYFLDFKSDDSFFADEEGRELPDVEAAHHEALGVLANVIIDVVIEGAMDQHFAVQVRDDLGPVLELTAIYGSKISRKQ